MAGQVNLRQLLLVLIHSRVRCKLSRYSVAYGDSPMCVASVWNMKLDSVAAQKRICARYKPGTQGQCTSQTQPHTQTQTSKVHRVVCGALDFAACRIRKVQLSTLARQHSSIACTFTSSLACARLHACTDRIKACLNDVEQCLQAAANLRVRRSYQPWCLRRCCGLQMNCTQVA